MLRKYSRLLFRFAAVSFRDMSEFRLDFFTSVAHYLVYQALFMIFWKSILAFTSDVLGDWTFPDLVVLSAFTLLATAITQWFAGFGQLSRKVVMGDVDKYLSKPVSPLFALLAEEMNALASLQQLVSAALILLGVCLYFNVEVSLASVFSSLLLLALGCGVLTLLEGTVALLAFWFGDVSRLHRLLTVTRELERYPINLFPPWLRGLLTWILPLGLVSTYPALVFLGKSEAAGLYLAIGLVLALTWGLIFRLTWERALVRHESFGG